MSLTTDTMSAADLKAITGGNDDGILGGGFGALIVLVILIGMMNGSWGGFGGGFGGFGGAAMMGCADGWNLYPWLNNSQNINNGFRDQMLQSSVQGIQNAITSGVGDIQLGIAGINQNICQTGAGIVNGMNQGFAGVNASIVGAQNSLAQQMYNNEIANLNRSFAEQTANTQGFSNVQSQLAQCCCDNRLATCQTQNMVQNEGNVTRFADANNTRDIIDATNRTGQAILDKLCALELDGVKGQLAQAQRENVALQNAVNIATMQASQVAQTAELRQNNATQLNNLVSELRSCPIPAQPVYGSQPIFSCGGNNNGCGCGCGVA